MKTFFDNFKTTFRDIALIFGLCLTALSAFGQANLTVASSVTAGTPTTLLSNGVYQIYNITFFNSSNVASTLKFYDSTAGSVSNVQAAYVSYSTISTNWTDVFTNAQGLVITNTFTGVAQVGTTVNAITNERPVMVNFAVAASGNRTVNVSWLPALGATVTSTTSGLVEIGYKRIAP